MIDIQYFGNFMADKRISMDEYLHQLLVMMSRYQTDISCQSYIPSSIFSQNPNHKLALRLARYISYPRQVKSLIKNHHTKTVYHICDHGYAHLLNVLPKHRTIVTVHDLIPLLRYKGFIENNKTSKRPLLSQYSLSYLNKAAHVVAISENTKNDLLRFNLVDEKRISVIYSGILSDSTPDHRTAMQCKIDIHPFIKNLNHTNRLDSSKSKFLLVCGNSFYKNLPLSIKIYQALLRKHANIKLVHWGFDSHEWQQAKSQLANQHDIIEIPYLPDNDKVKALYKAVDCVLFPSLYEGFGLPPIEAMALGTPAITSNLASLPEVIGNKEYCCDIDNIDDFTDKITRMLFDESYRQKAILHGLAFSKNFTWKKTIHQLTQLYQSI